MNRREFMVGAGMATGMFAVEHTAFGQNVKQEKKERSAEFDRTQSQEKGEAQLLEFAGHARPEINTALYIHNKKEAWAVDSYDGHKEKSDGEDKDVVHFSRLLTVINKEANSSDAVIDLYRVGSAVLPKITEAKAEEEKIRKDIESKRLLSHETWMAYLPYFNDSRWAHSDVMMNAYAAYKYKNAESHVVTPYGTISFHVQEGREPWAAYNELYNESEDVMRAMKDYGGDVEVAANSISITGTSNPVITVRETLNALWERSKPASGVPLEESSPEYTMKKFVELQNKRLGRALKNFFSAHNPNVAEFDIEMDEVVGRIKEGGYKDFEALSVAVEKAYALMSIDLKFTPSKEMESKKKF